MNTRLKCLLLDDELPGLSYLRMMCAQIPGLEVIRAFSDPLKFLEESKKIDFDLCILDIEMPQLSGLEVAQALKDKPVIFTSAYKQYAADAFDIDAIDYIRKPIQKERLEKAIQKATERLSKNISEKQFIQLNTNKGKALLFFNQLIKITNSASDKRDKLALLDNGEQLVLKNISFEQLLSELPDGEFCRINKKEIISLKGVKFYSHNEIVVTISGTESKSPLSDNFKRDFIIKITK